MADRKTRMLPAKRPSGVKESDGEACPHCGGTNGITTNDRANGWIRRWVTWAGDTDSTSFDSLVETISATGRCVDCNRVVMNPAAKLNEAPAHD